MLFWFVIFTHLLIKVSLMSQFYFSDFTSIVTLIFNDLVILSIICFIYTLSEVLLKKTRYIFKVFAFLIFICYVIDFILLTKLNSRLYLSDITKFQHHIITVIGWKYTLISIFYLSIILYTFTYKSNITYTNKFTAFVTAISLFSFFHASSGNFYSESSLREKSVRSEYFDNIININMNNTFKVEYTDEFVKSFNSNSKLHCEELNIEAPNNIFLILVESWSNYQSLAFGGTNNWTENLDNLANNNIKFENFYSNGFTTEAALYSLFTGFPLLPSRKSTTASGGVGLLNMSDGESLIKKIGNSGYLTQFITSGDLQFLDKRAWLERIGFEKILGNEVYPDENKKFLFDSVSDENLFTSIESFLDGKSRQLVVIENVSTHAPFIFPDEYGEVNQSEAGAFKYMDTHLSELINSLNKDNNLIFVLSDHRAPTKITEEEDKYSGLLSMAKVPAFAIWNGLNLSIKNRIQHTDIITSVHNLIIGKRCYRDYYGSLFPLENTTPATCIIHSRGDDRSLATLKCKDDVAFNIRLNGDKTSVYKENNKQNSSMKDNEYVNIINNIRIKQAIESK
nr:hypothetical protein BCU00_18755 [Vibrio breoganii]